MKLSRRPRRNRKNEVIRRFHRETWFSQDHLVYPLFIFDGEGRQPIASMPQTARLGREALLEEVGAAWEMGIRFVVLFPAITEDLKTPRGEECANPEGLIPQSIARLKENFPGLMVVTDVALDPYSSDGHDGIVSPDGRILNDETVEVLVQQALTQARAGADIIAPSDMMDGRIGAIRSALDAEGFNEVLLLSYTAKFASKFYGPFRDALNSAPKFGDKSTYQMDPANSREALRELALDEEEGADIVMVKPAGPYLDIIYQVRAATTLPVAAYQVSGEYAMLTAAIEKGWLDERGAVMESLFAIRRAGADLVLTYFAAKVARWLHEG